MQNIIGSHKFSRENRDPPQPSLLREGACHWGKVFVSVDKFSREFSAKYHRKPCKTSSEATNSLEKIETHPIPPCIGRECLLLRIGMISDEEVLAPSLNREGWGGSPAGVGLPFCGTLVAPVTPFRGGCQPFIQRRCGTRAPLNTKIWVLGVGLPPS